MWCRIGQQPGLSPGDPQCYPAWCDPAICSSAHTHVCTRTLVSSSWQRRWRDRPTAGHLSPPSGQRSSHPTGCPPAQGRGEVQLSCSSLLRGSAHGEPHRAGWHATQIVHRRGWGGGPIGQTRVVAHVREASFRELNGLKMSYSREHESAQAGGQQTGRRSRHPLGREPHVGRDPRAPTIVT